MQLPVASQGVPARKGGALPLWVCRRLRGMAALLGCGLVCQANLLRSSRRLPRQTIARLLTSCAACLPEQVAAVAL